MRDEQQPICGRRERAGLTDGQPAGSPGGPIHAPCSHPGLERSSKGGLSCWNSLGVRLVKSRNLYGVGLYLGEP